MLLGRMKTEVVYGHISVLTILLTEIEYVRDKIHASIAVLIVGITAKLPLVCF